MAIRYSHARTDARPSYVSRRRHARRNALLDEVLGLLERPEQAVAVDVQLAAMPIDAGAEGLLVERPEVVSDEAHGV